MSHSAAKYARVFQIELRKITEYRLNFVLTLLRVPIHITMLLLVWTTIFRFTGATQLAGMTLPVFIMYIIVARLCDYCQSPWIAYEFMEDHIKTGRIALFVTRPLRFPLFFFSQLLGNSSLYFSVVLCVLAAGNATKLAGINYIFPPTALFCLFVLSLAVAIVLGISIYYCITLAMLWVGDVWSVWSIWDGINQIMSGQLIPLTINPTFALIASYLPFKHLVYTPVSIYLGMLSVNEALIQICVQLSWFVFFVILGSIILRVGLARMDNQGG